MSEWWPFEAVRKNPNDAFAWHFIELYRETRRAKNCYECGRRFVDLPKHWEERHNR